MRVGSRWIRNEQRTENADEEREMGNGDYSLCSGALFVEEMGVDSDCSSIRVIIGFSTWYHLSSLYQIV